MKDKFVRDWMTTNVISIPRDLSLPDAYRLMKNSQIRRLPVLANQKLVGIVTLGDIREANPSSATSLSFYEINYLLSNLKIDKIMTKEVITVSAEATLAQAAHLMLENKIGGLPVMDGERLVGIITESDIFRFLDQEFGELEEQEQAQA
jgi:acetoin utilization protein AcuB